MTLDNDWEDPSEVGRASMACRIGRFDGNAESAAWLVPSGVAYPDATTFGQSLSREQALEHPYLADFWEVVDFLLLNDVGQRPEVEPGQHRAAVAFAKHRLMSVSKLSEPGEFSDMWRSLCHVVLDGAGLADVA